MHIMSTSLWVSTLNLVFDKGFFQRSLTGSLHRLTISYISVIAFPILPDSPLSLLENKSLLRVKVNKSTNSGFWVYTLSVPVRNDGM